MSQGEFGRAAPEIRTEVPGPESTRLGERLRRVESRNVTFLGPDFPVFWTEARGANVRDADGNVFVDLTGAFGVALLGHGEPGIHRAEARQAERLAHGMGDVHPPAIKVELLERLDSLLPWEASRTVLATSGSEAMEVALKTALLATGRPGILGFEGGYHGLTLGSLAATARKDFRAPFRERIYEGSVLLPFPGPGEKDEVLERIREALEEGAPGGAAIGAVVVEPVQGRGGVRIPPEGFLEELGSVGRETGAVVIADEVFTGAGRCGSFLASTAAGLVPDLVCLGKALGGGFPLSACAGPPEIMDAWPESRGEALHTSTFLGHPATCAAALAFLDIVEEEGIFERAALLGRRLLADLQEELDGVEGVEEVRGQGLLLGIEVGPGRGAVVAARALKEGVLVLPAGDHGEVVELAPPVALTGEQARISAEILGRAIRKAWP